MDAGNFHAGDDAVTNVNQQSLLGISIPTAAMASLAATLLISFGVVFQLGELGYGPYSQGGIWTMSLIARGAWTLLETLDLTTLWDLPQIWLLSFVVMGLAILSIARRGSRSSAKSQIASRIGESHGR